MNRGLLPSCPDIGPFDPAVVGVRALLVGGRPAAVVHACASARPTADALGDRVSVLFLDHLRAEALLELGRPDEAEAVARVMLDGLGPGGDSFWRARALALAAAAEVDRGRLPSALDPLAEALAIVETAPPRRRCHVLACSAAAAVLMRLLLFEWADRLATTAARAAIRGTGGGGLDPGAAALVVRQLVQVHALWSAQLDLLGHRAEAAEHHLATISATMWMRSLAEQAGSSVLAACAIAVEAFATERLHEPRLARARARAALAGTADPDSKVEWLPGLAALARAAAAEGDMAEARRLLEQADRAGTPQHRQAWAVLVQMAAIEVEELAEQREGGADHPAGVLWRKIVISGMRRIWNEREVRAADLRHRVLGRELAASHLRVQQELLVDPLTGLGNRRRLEHELALGRARAALFLDVDDFKLVNDRCGHEAGDEVLRRMASVLRGCCRSGDVVVRYGGDEFVVLPEHPEGIRMLGERILGRVRAQNWRALTGGVGITVSVGIARDEEDLRAALRRSDQALLAAKRAGRDGLVQL